MTALPRRADDLQRYLRLLVGPQPVGRLLEIRFRLRGGGMGREFVPAESCARAAGIIIRRLALVTDVYVGVALRDRRAGGRDAIGRCHLLFVEIDTPGAEDRLKDFPWPATATISSGGEGRRHCYWELCAPVGPHECERANRRLAYRLGGDPVSVDASRVLRPPTSWNWKYEPRRSVRLLNLDRERQYELAELVDGLPDPPVRKRPARRARVRELKHPLDEVLLGIPAEQYVRALTGRESNRAGKLHCPFHDLSVGEATAGAGMPARSRADASVRDRVSADPLLLVPPPVYFERLTGLRVGRSGKLRCLFHDDRDPSLHVYPEAGRGWYCFGCGRGGSVYDLAALLCGRKTRGGDFLELRRELEKLLL